jgi:hypothetical protein
VIGCGFAFPAMLGRRVATCGGLKIDRYCQWIVAVPALQVEMVVAPHLVVEAAAPGLRQKLLVQ